MRTCDRCRTIYETWLPGALSPTSPFLSAVSLDGVANIKFAWQRSNFGSTTLHCARKNIWSGSSSYQTTHSYTMVNFAKPLCLLRWTTFQTEGMQYLYQKHNNRSLYASHQVCRRSMHRDADRHLTGKQKGCTTGQQVVTSSGVTPTLSSIPRTNSPVRPIAYLSKVISVSTVCGHPHRESPHLLPPPLTLNRDRCNVT